jgi:hypothetical protein
MPCGLEPRIPVTSTPVPTPSGPVGLAWACTYSAWKALPDIGAVVLTFAMLFAIASIQVW